MPRLEDYLQERELLDAGRYTFTLQSVEENTKNKKEYPTVQLKGKVNGENYVIFRYLHPKMLWLVARELLALGASRDTDIDVAKSEDVVQAYEQYINQGLNVSVTQSEYNNRTRNDFEIIGLSDGVASGAV